MARRGERDLKKERFWRHMVRRWRRSGLTSRAFCQEHSLSEASCYAWRQTLAERAQQSHGSADHPPVFVPVQVVPAPEGASLEVVLGPGRVVRVLPGFDVPTLRQLLAVLEEPSC